MSNPQILTGFDSQLGSTPHSHTGTQAVSSTFTNYNVLIDHDKGGETPEGQASECVTCIHVALAKISHVVPPHCRGTGEA